MLKYFSEIFICPIVLHVLLDKVIHFFLLSSMSAFSTVTYSINVYSGMSPQLTFLGKKNEDFIYLFTYLFNI